MTKILLAYDLVRPFTEDDTKAIAAIHGYYGFNRVKLAPTLDKIEVEYDASRLTEKDVEAALVRFGIPVKRKWEVP